jgi:hypothetical protein
VELGEKPLITVVVPLIDTRGDAAEHILSWTREQSLARERYQVIVASPPGVPELERQVSAVLSTHDRLLLVDTDEVGLYDAAAAQADADWLLPTESHCLGHRDCLAHVVDAIADDPELEALTLDHGHIVHNAVDRLCARWFDEVYGAWEQPQTWTRLNLVGFAIRADAYNEEGGLNPRYGLFCSFLLAARMHRREARIRHIGDAHVDHVHTHGIREHHEHTADYAHGSCTARAELDRGFSERYFGHAHTWANGGRFSGEAARPVSLALARAAARTARERPQALPALSRELAGWLAAASFGMRPHLLWRRLRFLFFELTAERLPLPGDLDFRQYLRALDEIGKVAELEWLHAHNREQLPALIPGGRQTIEELGGALLPVHGLESHDAGRFRWTEPVCLLRCSTSAEGELVIDTGGVRGAPLEYVRSVYVDGRRVPATDLHEHDGSTLHVPLARAASNGPGIPVVIILEPLCPADHGSPDNRRLGMPVFSLELTPS